jgi:hypothetical protein
MLIRKRQKKFSLRDVTTYKIKLSACRGILACRKITSNKTAELSLRILKNYFSHIKFVLH